MRAGCYLSDYTRRTELAVHKPGGVGCGTTAKVVTPINPIPAHETIDAEVTPAQC